MNEKVASLLTEIPPHIKINAASKFRTPKEVESVIECGIEHIGFNYIQEGIHIIKEISNASKAIFHFIGHLQSNKTKLAVEHFHSIDTVHSLKLAKAIHHQASRLDKPIDIMVQVKSPLESHKNGVFLEEAIPLIQSMSPFNYIKIRGLLAMGAATKNPEDQRAFFRECKHCFETIKTIKQDNLKIDSLSMGMSDSYKIAIEEGATQVRLGTSIYGPRPAT